MRSPFDESLEQADDTILSTMMSDFEINGAIYPAVYDEENRTMEGILSANELSTAAQSTARRLTLFRKSGYKPRVGDEVSKNGKTYFVKSYYYEDGLLILRIE